MGRPAKRKLQTLTQQNPIPDVPGKQQHGNGGSVARVPAFDWQQAHTLQAAWRKTTKLMFTAMVCCGICGVVEFGGHGGSMQNRHSSRSNYKAMLPPVGFADLPTTPYGMANAFMAEFTVASDGKWWVCNSCANNEKDWNKRVELTPHIAPDYARTLLAENPLSVLLLSVVDAGVHLQSYAHGFAEGRLTKHSLLEGPLVTTGCNTPDPATHITSSLKDLLAVNLRTNPALQIARSLLEWPVPQYGVPVPSNKFCRSQLSVVH